MVPKSVKGKLFMLLSFLNVTIASFFAALGNLDQVVMSSITTLFCFIVWILELPSNNSKSGD